MQQTLESRIRERVCNYLDGVTDLSALHDWLASILWDIEDSGEPGAIELAYAVELLFSEYSENHRTQGDFQEELKSLMRLPAHQP